MRIAASTEAITPSLPAPMGGYDGADRLATRSAGALEANLLLFGEGPGAFAIVALDTLFAGRELSQAVTRRFAERHGLAPDRVLILASHTHFAPMLDTGKPRIGTVSRAALDETIDRVSQAIDALRGQDAATVEAGTGFSDAGVNRRRHWPWPTLVRVLGRTTSAFYMADNPKGRCDRRIRTAVYRDAQGAAVAAFWSYACHPVGFPLAGTASADYPGIVRDVLRAHYGALLPVIFAPGCMGDIRPRSPAVAHERRAPLRSALDLMAYGPQCRGFSYPQWQAWAKQIADDVVDATRRSETTLLPTDPVIPAAVASRPLVELIAGRTAVERFSAKAAVLPGIGRVVALSCEPVTAIADIFARHPDDVILGYEGNVFGYLPDEAMIAEGGYEATRFMPFFGIEGVWREGLDRQLGTMADQLTC